MSCLVFQSNQVSLQTLVFAQQGLHAGQVTSKVIRSHELLLLLDPADGLIHIPFVGIKTHSLYSASAFLLMCQYNEREE